MPTIREMNLNDLLSRLPEWGSDVSVPAESMFIGTMGFEERSPVCFKRWIESSEQPGVAVLVTYPTNSHDNEERWADALFSAASSGITVHMIQYDKLTIIGELATLLRNVPAEACIALDISSTASYVLYPILHAVCTYAKQANLRIHYTEALDYYPLRGEWDKFMQETAGMPAIDKAIEYEKYSFQSKGPQEIYESPIFPGRNLDGLPSRLLAIPNFSFNRVNEMVTWCADRYTIAPGCPEWIIGIPRDTEKFEWRATALVEMFDCSERNHPVSTLHYKEIIASLHEIWEASHHDEFLMIVDLGSKAQHLGAFLFLYMHPDLCLVLSEPKEFKAGRFSEGVGPIHVADFGHIADFIAALQKWNQIVFTW